MFYLNMTLYSTDPTAVYTRVCQYTQYFYYEIFFFQLSIPCFTCLTFVETIIGRHLYSPPNIYFETP